MYICTPHCTYLLSVTYHLFFCKNHGRADAEADESSCPRARPRVEPKGGESKQHASHVSRAYGGVHACLHACHKVCCSLRSSLPLCSALVLSLALSLSWDDGMDLCTTTDRHSAGPFFGKKPANPYFSLTLPFPLVTTSQWPNGWLDVTGGLSCGEY